MAIYIIGTCLTNARSIYVMHFTDHLNVISKNKCFHTEIEYLKKSNKYRLNFLIHRSIFDIK